MGNIDAIAKFFTQENQLLVNLSNFFTIITNLSILGIFVGVVRKIWISFRKIHTRPDCLTEKETKRYTKVYIKTRLSTKNPNQTTKRKTYNLNDFIKKYLLKGDDQYHWILGEAGMGKTAFLINLYFFYNCRIFRKYDVFYLSLRNSDAIEQIRRISAKNDSKKAILLLDAFDESKFASSNPSEAKKEFENETKKFCKVVFSCRTQFFNTVNEEPQLVEAPRAVITEDEKCVKHYVCPFSSLEVVQYLIKQYSVRVDKIYKAKKAIEKSTDLMARPLLLSFIDDIISDGGKYEFSYQIYNTLVRKWIDREIQFIKKTSDNEISVFNYSQSFWKFIYCIVDIMVKKQDTNSDYSVSSSDLTTLCNAYNIKSEFSKRPRTLLTRICDDTFQFSHQSIFEFLLADGIRSGNVYFNFENKNVFALDQYKLFLEQMHMDNKLNSIIEKDALRIVNSFNDIFVKYIGGPTSVTVDMFKKRILFQVYNLEQPLSTLTIGQLKKLAKVLLNQNYRYPVLLALDGNEPAFENVYVILFEEAKFTIKNRVFCGRVLFDVNHFKIILENLEKSYFSYWNINMFVDKMTLNIILEFIAEQISVADKDENTIQTLCSEPDLLTIEVC